VKDLSLKLERGIILKHIRFHKYNIDTLKADLRKEISEMSEWACNEKNNISVHGINDCLKVIQMINDDIKKEEDIIKIIQELNCSCRY
jgi:hypothetical protein